MWSRHAQVATAFIAPQSECPQMTISVTFRAATAYSTVALTPPGSGPNDGTIFPAFRMTNSSPGSRWVTSSGTILLSEQEMNSALGVCPAASVLNNSRRAGKTSFWKRRKPAMISRIDKKKEDLRPVLSPISAIANRARAYFTYNTTCHSITEIWKAYAQQRKQRMTFLCDAIAKLLIYWGELWCGWRGSNPRPLASEANTLSTELQPHGGKFLKCAVGYRFYRAPSMESVVLSIFAFPCRHF